MLGAHIIKLIFRGGQHRYLFIWWAVLQHNYLLWHASISNSAWCHKYYATVIIVTGIPAVEMIFQFPFSSFRKIKKLSTSKLVCKWAEKSMQFWDILSICWNKQGLKMAVLVCHPNCKFYQSNWNLKKMSMHWHDKIQLSNPWTRNNFSPLQNTKI